MKNKYIFILLTLLIVFISGCSSYKIEKEEFCGWSTEGSCNNDNDCVIGGCSNQVCQSKNEEPAITTCEYRTCYDATTYNLNCNCVENKCKWI